MQSLDDILGKMLDAMEEDNIWDSAAYAQQGLDYISNGGNINEAVSRDYLESQLHAIINTANKVREAERKARETERLREKRKNDLIDEIVNFRG